MIDQETALFLTSYLPVDYRKQVVEMLGDVHPTQVSLVRHQRRTDERVMKAILRVARREKKRRERVAVELKSLMH